MKSTNVKFSWLLLLFLMSIINDVFSQQLPDGKNEIVKDRGIMDSVYAKIITDYVE